jgi:IS30 family transposase
MKKYTQLSQDERYEIYATLKSKSSIATLARELGVHDQPSTVN